MSTRFLPMSWTSPLTVAKRIEPRPSSSIFSICGSRYATAVFITSADCRTNGSCISPLPKSSPTIFIPSSRWSLIIASGAIPDFIAKSRSSVSPTFSPSIILRCSRSSSGSAASSAARTFREAASSTPSKSCKYALSGSYVQSSPLYSRRS